MNNDREPSRTLLSTFLEPTAEGPRALLFLRTAVAFAFISSGALKFLYENQGPGRFAKIGLSPQLAYFVGAVELICGALVLLGLFARLAAIPLVIDMLVAIATTKIPLLFGPGPEPVAAPPKIGFLAFAYQSRLDLAMLLCCATVAAAGAGAWSLDAWLAKRRAAPRAVERARGDARTA